MTSNVIEYERPNDEMLQELSALYLQWYLPTIALYGHLTSFALEYQVRQDKIREKYAAPKR